jgi:hypothetical protein
MAKVKDAGHENVAFQGKFEVRSLRAGVATDDFDRRL